VHPLIEGGAIAPPAVYLSSASAAVISQALNIDGGVLRTG
jgi:hypothetical protein